jgi:hypothetical protein
MYHDKSGKKAVDPRDFMKLNKMCLKEKASDAKANHAFRKVNDARIVPVVKPKVNRLPGEEFSFGRANRPQTPVEGIIRNDFGEESVSQLQNKYAAWRQMQSSHRGLSGIRMTNA